MAGPGVGDCSAVAPVVAQDAATVGVTAPPEEVRVLSFQEKEALEHFQQQNWEEKEVLEVYNFLHAVKGSPTREPQGSRAQTLPQSEEWMQVYPLWFEPFKAGQLFVNELVWQQVFEDCNEQLPGRIRKWCREGYSVWCNVKKFGTQPGVNRLSESELQFATQQAQEWVSMGALEEIAMVPAHVLVCNVVVAYRGGKMDRVCWAGNAINEGVQTDPFRMESLQTVVRIMQSGDWMFSFDLKKGYFQVPLKQAFKEFTYMRIGDRYFRWNVLMFGLSAAPKDFSFIIKKVLGLLRKQGIRCCFFIDDIIFFAATYEEAVTLRKVALDLFYKLGFRVSWPKSLLKPGTLIRHLGLDICSDEASVWAPEDKVMRMKELAGDLLLQSGQAVPGRMVATFVGVLGALRLAVPAALILSRGLMRTLSQLPVVHGKAASDWGGELRDYDGTVHLTALAIAELRFWMEVGWKMRGAPVKEVAQSVCFVDACPQGAGAVVARRLPGGEGRDWAIDELRAGAWEGKMEAASTAFELLNIWNVVHEFQGSWKGTLVQVCSDNVGAVFITGRGCMRNACLHALSLGIWRNCWVRGISLCTQYIGGDGIIAAGADGLSRDSDHADCRLAPQVFQALWREWHMEVDMFCSPKARQSNPVTGELLLAVSPYRCERRVGIDGMTFSCPKVLYAFPPSALLRALIPRIQKLGLKVVLIVPVWNQAEWWPLVADRPAMQCGQVQDCVIPGEAGLCHPFGVAFNATQARQTHLRAVAFNL